MDNNQINQKDNVKTLPSVYQYTNYREYLKDYYYFQKQISSSYSYEVFSKKAGLKSTNYLALVMQGKRNLTVANIHVFATVLGFLSEETEYFEALVLCNQASSEAEVVFYQKRLDKLKSAKPQSQVKLHGNVTIKDWYIPAIILCLNLYDPNSSESLAEFIASKLRLPTKLISDALLELERHKILQAGKNGKLSFKEQHYIFSDPKPNAAQMGFIKRQLQRMLEIYPLHYGKTGRYYAHTFTASRKFSPNEYIYKMIEGLTMEADKTPPERIMQINVQYYPLDGK